MTSHLVENLTPSQAKAVLHKDGPLLVIAGPGSGKTRVITHRIAALIESGVKPWNICAITFTNRAAAEMRERVEAMGVPQGTVLSTFHSLCVRLLRIYAQQAQISSNFSIYSDDDQKRCIKDAIKKADLDSSSFQPAKFKNAISKLKNELESPEAFAARANDYLAKTVSKVYTHYQKALQDNNALDFDDLLLKVAFLLRDFPDIRHELNQRYKYLLVDEYQDTNHAQYQIAKGLASDHSNICVTGDPDQSIYRWRGADIQNILDFEKDWPNAVTVKLQENFRSTEKILKAADQLIANNSNRKAKSLIPTITGGSDINFFDCDDETDEAYTISREIKELIDKKVNPQEIAIFYRINSMSRTLEESLINNKVPYQIVRGVEFYSRKEIRDMLAYLKALVNPQDNIALLRIINTPARGIGKTSIGRVENFAALNNISVYQALQKVALIDTIGNATKSKIAKFAAMMNSISSSVGQGAAPVMEQIFNESGLAESYGKDEIKGESALENINELINSAKAYDQQAEEPTLVDYLQSIALYSDSDAYQADQPKVALMTLHAAKGLEFDNVFLIGLEDGILPHERSSFSNEELEEERRLCFVGITRARKNLNISYASHRMLRGQYLRSTPSQFLSEIGHSSVTAFKPAGLSYDDSDSQLGQYQKPTSIFASSASSAKKPAYTNGQLVRHKKFDLGRVTQFIDAGENSIVVVKFNTGQTRSLMLKYAKLEIIN